MIRKPFVYLLCALPFLLASTLTVAARYKPINEIPDSVPETEEEQQIWEIGKAHQKQVRETGEAITDPDMEQSLEKVAARLLGEMVQTIGMEVNVIIFKDPTVNAWVYPDGTIAVQTGLLAELKNEAQLAAILGHEISHFLNRHAYIQIKSKQKQSAIGKGLGLIATAALAAKTGNLNTGLMGAGQVWTDLVTSGYSRKLETKADEQGLELLNAAGYAPEQALPAFEALRIKEDDQVNIGKIWSSHPDIDSRLKNLKRQIKKIKNKASTVPSEQEYVRTYGKAMLVDAQLDLQRRRFARAHKTLKRYTDGMPDEPIGHFFTGEAYRKQYPEGPDFGPRTRAYQAAITADQEFAMAYKELGMTFRQQHKQEEAVNAFQSYLKLAPEAADAPIISWYLEELQNGSHPGSQPQGTRP